MSDDVEALTAVLWNAAIFSGGPLQGRHRDRVGTQARLFLSSSWLADHDERVRAAERQRLEALDDPIPSTGPAIDWWRERMDRFYAARKPSPLDGDDRWDDDGGRQ